MCCLWCLFNDNEVESDYFLGYLNTKSVYVLCIVIMVHSDIFFLYARCTSVCSVRATGPVEVPFQNDSPVTLLAHVMGIIGSVEQTMLAQESDTDKWESGLNSSVMFLF
jgi:hypothetical protein